MSGNNSHTSPELNTSGWNFSQGVNNGSSMNTNSMAYPPQGPAHTGFNSEAQYHNLNTSYPSVNMPIPIYDEYAQAPNPIGFGDNHGSSMRPVYQPLRPQAAPNFNQNLLSPTSLQAQTLPPTQSHRYHNQPALQSISPYPNGAGQNVHSRLAYPGTYQNSPRGPTRPILPAPYPQIQLETQKAYRREKRQREESDSEDPPPKKKGTKRPRVKKPPPVYNKRYPRPPSWGVASDGSPLFVYNDDGELRTDRKYTAEEIRNYIENCPRELRIWVQQSPTQVADRLGNRNTCMWMGCIKQGHKIDTGFFRIAFDEFHKQSKKGYRDPLRPAAVMHMWCYEQCFDPLVDYHDYKLKADKRNFQKETRNPINITNKGKDIVREAFKPWLLNTEFSERPREYSGSLCSALNEYHLSSRSQIRKAAQEKGKRRGECNINIHRGDLMVFCHHAKKSKQDMSQKDHPVNRFQFRPRPKKLRVIDVDEDSDFESDSESDSEIPETYAGQGGAMAQPEEQSEALKPLGEKSVNSRSPAARVGARRKGSRPEADGAENEEPKGSMRDGVEDDKRREITREKAASNELKLPGLEISKEPGLVPTELGSPPDSPSDILFSDDFRRDIVDIDDEHYKFLFEFEPDSIEPSGFVEQPFFEESPAPEERPEPKELPELKLPEPKLPEPKLPEPKLPEPKELPEPKLPELKLPEPKESPNPKEIPEGKELPGVENLSGSGGSQVAEAGPSGASC